MIKPEETLDAEGFGGTARRDDEELDTVHWPALAGAIFAAAITATMFWLATGLV